MNPDDDKNTAKTITTAMMPGHVSPSP